MADPGSFFSWALTDATTASAATGVLPSVILAQWADETGYGSSLSYAGALWNFAGVSIGGSVNKFATEQIGLDAYITTLNQVIYNTVRQSHGYRAQCIALGTSPWAGGHYDARKTGVPGVDLISIIQTNNLSQYDPEGSETLRTLAGGQQGSVNPGAPDFSTSPIGSLGQTITEPPPGMGSDISKDSFIVNGSRMTADVSNALINASLELSIDESSILVLTLADSNRTIINNEIFMQRSVVNLDGDIYQLVAVEKQLDTVIATFEPWVVSALRQATGAFTITPGQMTRTDFARLLVSQVQGAVFVGAPSSFLADLPLGDMSGSLTPGLYFTPPAASTSTTGMLLEQISRGTIDNILEDSWACLRRLATEIQWRCFAVGMTVYFVPDGWLAQLPVAANIEEFVGGVLNVDGIFDLGQPLGNITADCLAGSWTPAPGQSVTVSNLGAFSQGTWLVSKMVRLSVFEADIAVTMVQPLPALPEPETGGAQAAVGAGYSQPGAVQSPIGVGQAAQAIAYAQAQIGKPYVIGGENPNSGFDCSGLMQAAYASAGVPISRVSQTQQAAGPNVPAGGVNLLPGDLVFFGPRNAPATHVAMFISYDTALGTGQMITADHLGAVIDQEPFTPTIGALWGTDVYQGATRPAP